MKKVLISLLIGVTMFGFAGCGQDYEANKITLDKSMLKVANISEECGDTYITEEFDNEYLLELYEIKEDIKGLKFKDEEDKDKYKALEYSIDWGIKTLKEVDEPICNYYKEGSCELPVEYYYFLSAYELLDPNNEIIIDEVYQLKNSFVVVNEDEYTTWEDNNFFENMEDKNGEVIVKVGYKYKGTYLTEINILDYEFK